MRARSFIALGCVAVMAAACADLFGFKDLQEAPPDASDAQADVSDAGSGDASDASDAPIDNYVCTPATWPTNPQQENAGDAGDFVLAIRHLYLETTPDGGASRAGYDLDGKCTTNDPSTASCTSSNNISDQVNGIDDDSIALMNALKGSPIGSNLGDDNVNASIASGTFTELIRLLNYNGGSDQPLIDAVQVAIQASPGIDTPGTPNFDGNDSWLVSSDDTVSTFNTYPTANVKVPGYVNKNVVVAKFQQPIKLHVILSGIVTGPLAITLQQATLTATIVPNGGAFSLTNGLIVGRWLSRDILTNVASLTVSNQALCDYYDASVMPAVAAQVCTFTDIRGAGPDDNKHPCDAVSVAVGFDAVPAKLGNITSYPTSSTPCTRDAGDCP